ncbi:SulP family inorganic anion transporter [Thalassospira sp. TSL5-1]|uniref:SulP family inorganic anion transporter n=1 Tax=Thalassospira sp. TSL5-1 TaxID=1544451 RepID=UPI00093E8E66|nr:sulfate permease [Thalassospira sp. TSL5-1]OKH90180.1 sulfate:proton symporter [Thalassospira sp. TSL5-1]
MRPVSRFFPILDWGRRYNRQLAANDFVAAVIVSIMLVPQSLAYAMLAGLPPEVGLYASILPLVAYAVFGTSATLAVGPVALISLMTASIIGSAHLPNGISPVSASMTLAVISGIILLAMGLFRLGFVANFLSHPVISGFVSASGVLIAVGQVRHLLGLPKTDGNLAEILAALFAHLPQVNIPTVIMGFGCLGFLFWVRKGLPAILSRLGLAGMWATFIVRAGPVLAVIMTTLASWYFDLASHGVKIVGTIPKGFPAFTLPSFNLQLWHQLALPALLISVIGFVETVSVAQTLAAKRRQRIRPDQELIALGMANLGAGFAGGLPVTGGFARSMVNFDAGAQTPAAGLMTAVGIAAATLFLTPVLYYLPQATLAATIIVAVLTLVDIKTIIHIFRYSRADFAAMVVTIALTLFWGIEPGIVSGVVVSLMLYLHRTSRPHIAVVGQVPGTEHFRNILRHDVATGTSVLTVRPDESLYFANCRYLEDRIYALIAENPALRHVVLMCSAINEIDSSGLESLHEINARLRDSGVTFNLSEVKGPVMDRLEPCGFIAELSGKVFLSQYDALSTLDPSALTPCRIA